MMRSKRTLLKKPDLPSAEAYTSCFDLPLYNWIELTLTKDLKFLVKRGSFTAEALDEIYSNICDEYRQISGDTDSNYLFDLQKQIFLKDKTYMLILAIVNQLRVTRSEKLIAILQNDFNFNFQYVDLQSDLDKTLKRARSKLIELKLQEAEFQELNEKQGSKELSRMDFIEQLSILGQFQGYQINPKKTSLAEYIAILKRLSAEVEAKMKRNPANA